jgi:hypothetical protein
LAILGFFTYKNGNFYNNLIYTMVDFTKITCIPTSKNTYPVISILGINYALSLLSPTSMEALDTDKLPLCDKIG